MALFINGVGEDTFNTNGVSIDNLYVDGVLVWSLSTGVPPIYELTEPLVNDGGFNYLDNSASGGSQFDGKLLTSGGTAWFPTTGDGGEYPQDGTIDLSGGNKADTQWTAPSDEEWTFSFIYDVIMDTSYKMFSLNSKGDGTADVLYDGVLTAESTGLLYVPLLTSMILTEDIVFTDVPTVPTCEITMSQYTFSAGDTATVTVTFNTIVTDFDIGSLTVPNGTLSNFAQDSDRPWIYTMTFTPDEDVSDDTNEIVLYSVVDGVHDQWSNEQWNNMYSANYTVNTAESNFPTVYTNLDQSDNVVTEFTANNITSTAFTDIPSVFKDSTGADVVGMSMTASDVSSGGSDGTAVYGACMGSETLALKQFYYVTSPRSISYVLPAGTYTFQTLSTRSSSNKDQGYTIDGIEKSLDAGDTNTGSHCLEWTGVVSDGSTPIPIDIELGAVSGSNYLNAIKITRTA